MRTEDGHSIDHLLDALAQMAEEGHELTDDELQLLLSDNEAAGTMQLLDGLRTAVAPQPDVEAEWARLASQLPTSQKRQLWRSYLPWLSAAAAIVIGVLLLWPRQQQTGGQRQQEHERFVAYQKPQQKQDIVLTIGVDHGQELNLSDEKDRQTTGTTLSAPGRLVLDYNNQQRRGVGISDEVEQNTVSIPAGKDFQIVFADGTRAWLHTDTRLTYPSRFVGKERRVYLQGEAYFDVAHDPQHPFVIYTDRMQARVLGTELNVSCYPDREPHVALIKGRVQVRANDEAFSPLNLQPGQGASLTAQGFTAKEENMEPYINWRNGYIYFDEAPLVDVVVELGRWYGLNVVIEGRELIERHVRFFCPRSESAERAIELLNSFHEFSAHIEDGTLVISNI